MDSEKLRDSDYRAAYLIGTIKGILEVDDIIAIRQICRVTLEQLAASDRELAAEGFEVISAEEQMRNSEMLKFLADRYQAQADREHDRNQEQEQEHGGVS